MGGGNRRGAVRNRVLLDNVTLIEELRFVMWRTIFVCSSSHTFLVSFVGTCQKTTTTMLGSVYGETPGWGRNRFYPTRMAAGHIASGLLLSGAASAEIRRPQGKETLRPILVACFKKK
jgi:hypothetical protein